MPAERRSRENMVILFVVGLLALNYPLLSLFDRMKLVLGIPLLFLYVFVMWLVIIALTAMVVERAERRGDERPDSTDSADSTDG
jgi:membrane protein implicated in regulation of membrane protease activity